MSQIDFFIITAFVLIWKRKIFCQTGLPFKVCIQGHLTGCHAENGDQVSNNQVEPGQAIKSAVAYFPSISCMKSCRVALYMLLVCI